MLSWSWSWSILIRVEDLENALGFISQQAEKFLGVIPEKYLLDCDRPAIAL